MLLLYYIIRYHPRIISPGIDVQYSVQLNGMSCGPRASLLAPCSTLLLLLAHNTPTHERSNPRAHRSPKGQCYSAMSLLLALGSRGGSQVTPWRLYLAVQVLVDIKVGMGATTGVRIKSAGNSTLTAPAILHSTETAVLFVLRVVQCISILSLYRCTHTPTSPSIFFFFFFFFFFFVILLINVTNHSLTAHRNVRDAGRGGLIEKRHYFKSGSI